MEKRKNKILPIAILFVVILVVALVLIIKNANDKSYEIEEIKTFSYFKLYEDGKYGVIDKKGNILVKPIYNMIEIPNPSKAVFIGYVQSDGKEEQTEVLNAKGEKILTSYSRSNGNNV